MRYEIGYQPSYSLAILNLEKGEEVRCVSGAMVSMSGELVIEAKMNTKKGSGNFISNAIGAAARTLLTKESFFITSISAPKVAGEVTLAPGSPGDILAMELQGRSLIVQAGSYLASTNDIEVNTKWGGMKGLLGGEGMFFLRASGNGTLFLTSFGAIHKRELRPNEVYMVDTGHLVAYEEGVKMETALASGTNGGGFIKRAINSEVTGEGIVMKFTGPGTVWLQTRNPQAFGGWLSELLPARGASSSAAGSALDVVGNLMK